METKKLSRLQLLKTQAWAILWLVISWEGFKILIFLIFMLLNQDTSDTSLMSGIALVPAVFVFYKVQGHYKKKYLSTNIKNE